MLCWLQNKEYYSQSSQLILECNLKLTREPTVRNNMTLPGYSELVSPRHFRCSYIKVKHMHYICAGRGKAQRRVGTFHFP